MSLVSRLELKNCKLWVENTQAVENTHLIKLNALLAFSLDAYPYTKKHLYASKKSSSMNNSSKKNSSKSNTWVWIKTASSATINTCLFYLTCVYGVSVKCLFSACPVFSLFSCLAVNNCVGNVFYIFLNSCMWLEVFWDSQTAGLSKIQCSWNKLYQTCR